jgi:hypothetical protein
MNQAKPQLKSGAGEVQQAAANMGKTKPPTAEVLDPRDTSKTSISQGDIKKTEAADAARQRQAGQSQPSSRLAAGQEKKAGRNLATAQKQSKQPNKGGKGIGIQPAGKASKIAGKGVGKPLKAAGASQKPKLKKDAEAAAGRNLNKEKSKSIRQKYKGAKQKVKEVKDAAEQAGQQFTGEALRQSWLNLISSWGLTLIYINIHFIGKYFASSRYFSHFGQEWTAKLAKVKAAPGGGMAVKKINAGLKYVEIIALILLDFLLLAAVLLALIAMVLPFLLPFILVTTILNKIKGMMGL